MSVLKVENLQFSAGQFELRANFSLQHRVTGIFGPSGAGKTTLLELIAGLRLPTAGRVAAGERMLFDSAARIAIPPEQRQIAYLPQDLALFPHLTVRQNLLYGAKQAQAQNELDHVVKEFQLQHCLAQRPDQLSGGEKQRVAIGRALIPQPRLVLLDEPLSNLDRDLKERGLELFRRVRDHFSTPILYVTHDPNEIVELCDEVIILKGGHVLQQGPPRDLFRISQKPNWEFVI